MVSPRRVGLLARTEIPEGGGWDGGGGDLHLILHCHQPEYKPVWPSGKALGW